MFINKSKCQNANCNQCCKYCYVIGPTGPTGPTGSAGETLNYADFYALMPPDNTATVAPGTDVSFPQDGPNSGVSITRTELDHLTYQKLEPIKYFLTFPFLKQDK